MRPAPAKWINLVIDISSTNSITGPQQSITLMSALAVHNMVHTHTQIINVTVDPLPAFTVQL